MGSREARFGGLSFDAGCAGYAGKAETADRPHWAYGWDGRPNGRTVYAAHNSAAGYAAVEDAIKGVARTLWLHNKADLIDNAVMSKAVMDDNALHVSARTGAGLDALHVRLRELAQGEASDGGDGAFTARARHVEALLRARVDLTDARAQLDHEALDLAAEALRAAHDALGEITGRVRADDLLGHIFSSFCIGK